MILSSGQTALLKKLIYQPKNKDMEQTRHETEQTVCPGEFGLH